MKSGSIEFMSCVNSSAKMVAVNGERIVPPRMAAVQIRGQNPAPSAGSTMASTPPSAPPIISSGASTPPDVPEPSDTAQIVDLTSKMPMIKLRGTSPCSSAPMVS